MDFRGRYSMSWVNMVTDTFVGDWVGTLNELGLDLTMPPEQLATALQQPCDLLQTHYPDLPTKDLCWITPGLPAYSFLYYALASPHVTRKHSLTPPSREQIEIIENAVYAAQKFDLLEPAKFYEFVQKYFPNCQKSKDGSPLLKIVMFAYEYRPARRTPHGAHADICYSRTGLARIGTAKESYNPEARSLNSVVDKKPKAIPIIPGHYAAFLSVATPGNDEILGRYVADGDEERSFWVPVHKLFSGHDCLVGVDVKLNFQGSHMNEKLRRFHLHLGKELGRQTGWTTPEIDSHPFVLTNGIADFRPTRHAAVDVVPRVHAKLVESAKRGAREVGFVVPPQLEMDNDREMKLLSSSLLFISTIGTPGGGECSSSPEVVNARHAIDPSNPTLEDNLNDYDDVVDLVGKGNYYAKHYVDFTGEGWVAVQADMRPLPQPNPKSRLKAATLAAFLYKLQPANSCGCLPAYSLVCAPDFLPGAGQRAVLETVMRWVPENITSNIWYEKPDSLAEQRLSANVELNTPHPDSSKARACFDEKDLTITAVITTGNPLPLKQPNRLDETWEPRSILPDSAAGLFSPGWDVGVDVKDKDIFHFAMYALGSPFLTDSKLCAAQCAFWPAASPDTSRTYEPFANLPVVVPMLDSEIGLKDGQRGLLDPWDGVPGPVFDANMQLILYQTLANVDYVDNALNDEFTFTEIAKVDANEYVRRLVCMLLAYRAVGIDVSSTWNRDDLLKQKQRWAVLSFRKVDDHQELTNIGVGHGLQQFIAEPTYFMDIYQWTRPDIPTNVVGSVWAGIANDFSGQLRYHLYLNRFGGIAKRFTPGAKMNVPTGWIPVRAL
jgi:hypothetical protein